MLRRIVCGSVDHSADSEVGIWDMKTTTTDFEWFRDMIVEIIAERNLSEWESRFIKSIEDKIRDKIPLTDKQANCLIKIWETL